MSAELKILYVTTALNAPLHTGCTIRTMNLCGQLKKKYKVTMLAVSQFFIEESVEYAKQQFAFEQIKLKHYNEFFPPWGRFIKKWHMHWPYSRGIQADPADQALFGHLVGQHDVVWFHTLGAAFPFQLRKFTSSVMDLDDLNHCKYELRSVQQANIRHKFSAKIQAYKWKRQELRAMDSYDRIVVCSENDKTFLEGAEKICVVPNGFVRPDRDPVWIPPDPMRLGFIGTLGYGPNYEGLLWFRDKVWPLIRKQNPNITLRIVGSPPQPQYHVPSDGFEYLGYVEDPADEIRSWSAMIVPILFGGGTRIKIIEAFSRMCPVVSTPIGAHGIDGVHNEHFMLAEEPKDFADFCLKLSTRPDIGSQLAKKAWQLFNEKYTWDVIGQSVREIVENVSGRR